jgi:ABC-2 type transport system permease protein
VNAILAVMMREYLIRRTSLLWFFSDLAVPLLYLLMFGVGLDRAVGSGVTVGGETVRYNDFFLASVLTMACFASAINQSYGVFVDRDNGIFYEFLTYPMTRGQFMLGKVLFQCIMSLAQLGLVLVAAVWILDVQLNYALLPFVGFGMMAGTAAWFFFLAIFAFLIRRNDAFNTVINVFYFVFMFLSSLFYPLEGTPDWLRIISSLNPLTWYTDVMRWLLLGVGSGGWMLVECLLFGVFLLSSFGGALKALSLSVE